MKSYLKYKFKYLNLRNKITENFNQNGGMIWMENSRGNSNDGKYPPCYNICGATKAIFDILEKYSLVKKYNLLLDMYSVILCQEIYLKNKKCENTMLDERLMEVSNLMKNKEIKNKHVEIVNESINNEPKNSQIRNLMEMVTVLIEEQISNIFDENIEEKDLNKINKMNTVFYQVHYPVLASNC